MSEETIIFTRPEGDKVLVVWGLPEFLPWDYKWGELENVFSRFGLLYSVCVPTGHVGYAFIKYYSHQAAVKAIQDTDGKIVMGQSILKVTFSVVKATRQPWPLHISKCHQLASHYLHYNGWNIRIISLEDLGIQHRCIVELEIKQHDVRVEGAGYAESKTADICSTKKTAFNRACEKAFSQLALVLLPQGKLAAVLVLTS